jgi:hypothetical protein
MREGVEGRIGALGGGLFVVIEMGRQAIISPPPEGGETAALLAYATQHDAALRLFPWTDAVAAGGFMIFAITLIRHYATDRDRWLASIGIAGAALVFGVSLVLDALFGAFREVVTSDVTDGAAALLAGSRGVEEMFGYPLAVFLGASAGILIRPGSAWLGWAAAVLGAGFLAAGLAAALLPDVELEGPLFLGLLVWIVVGCVRLLRTREPAPMRA